MTRFPVLVLLQAVAKDSAWNSDVKGILVFCRFPKTPKLGRLQEPSAGAQDSSSPGRSPPRESCQGHPGGGASLGDTLLRAAQSPRSAGEDLPLQFMAGAHTGPLLSAQERTDGVVFTRAQASIDSALRRPPLGSSSSRENTGAGAKDS